MLKSLMQLKGYTIRATDGDIGTVHTMYFDDERWTIRYFVVDTGNWLPGRKVLISPIAVREISWGDHRVVVSLTREQVENSPDIDTEKPVSRQHEMAYFRYYGYPYYWVGPGIWGLGAYPVTTADLSEVQAQAEQSTRAAEPHLRDASAVKGHHIVATDGEIGHIDDFLIDDRTWTIRYLVVDTSNWPGGRRVLIAPDWVQTITWETEHVELGLSRSAIEQAPEYDPATEMSRDDEQRLYAHYGHTGYWSADERKADVRRLARLNETSEVKIAEGESDVRGWHVRAADGVIVGQVEHLIVDPDAMKVRYLEVGLAAGTERRDTRDVLIPMDQVELDRSTETVTVGGLPYARIVALPPFSGLPLRDGDEQLVRASFRTNPSETDPRGDARTPGRRS